jgi:hypothetical protein
MDGKLAVVGEAVQGRQRADQEGDRGDDLRQSGRAGDVITWKHRGLALSVFCSSFFLFFFFFFFFAIFFVRFGCLQWGVWITSVAQDLGVPGRRERPQSRSVKAKGGGPQNVAQ